MTTIILITAIWAGGLAIGVLWANPRRLANQALAVLCSLCAGWAATVYAGIRLAHAGHADAATHLFLADNVIAAFLPWANWLLKESLVVGRGERHRALRRSLPWFGIGLVLAALAFAPSFFARHSPAGAAVDRGAPYFAYITIELGAHAVIFAAAIRQRRRTTGIRRVETQYVILNIAVSCFLGAALNGLGSLLHRAEVKQLSFPIVLAMLGLLAWTMAVHRVFDTRQVFLSLAQRVVLMLGIAGLVHLLDRTLEAAVAPADDVLSMACGIGLGIWLDRSIRRWTGLDGRRALDRMRRSVINASRTEASTDDLMIAFEAMLRLECQTDVAALMTSPRECRTRLDLPTDHPGFAALLQFGWATPESLLRRRSAPGTAELLAFLEEHDLGLVLAVPRGSPSPALLIALGTKTNRGPFTYPEIERLTNIAELMDNILARSHLTTQAALQAKTEHLALMSRGLAHDLKNLITPISSFLVHTDRRFPPGSAEAEVHEAAKRSVRIINDYISEALFFANRLTPRRESVRVPRLLEGVRDATADRAHARGIRVACEAPDLVFVADAVLIQRLLVNLVSNAIDASPAGAAVTITVASPSPQGLRLQVSDRGTGIAPRDLKRVFDPYYTTKQFGDEIRGFGLGLTICQKIVALHGGTIALESRPDAGTTVTVDLPTGAESATIEPPAPVL